MYLLSFSIESECGLSRAASEIHNSIFIVNTVTSDFINNSVIAVTQSKNSPVMREYLTEDFSTLSIMKKDRYSLIYGIKKSHGIIGAIEKNGGIPIYPLIANNGSESFDSVVMNKEVIDKILAEVEKHNKIEKFEVTNAGSADLPVSSLLLPR